MSAFAIDLLACGDPRHLADLLELRERGLPVPHHYSSWASNGLPPGSLWCRATDASGALITAFAVELTPSRAIAGARIGRVDRIGRALHEPALPHIGEILRATADRIPRLLRLDVRVFDEDAGRRRRMRLALLQADAVPVMQEREYSHTLTMSIANLEETFLTDFSRRMRREVTRFLEHPGARIAPITDTALVGRMCELHADSFSRNGARAPNLEACAMLRDAARSGESILIGAFCGAQDTPANLVAYAWGRLHGDHIVYEAGGSLRAQFLHHLSPGYALLWDIAHWGHGRGATWMDLGGITPAQADTYNALAGVDAFKRRFSNEEIAVADEFMFQPRTALARLTGVARRLGRAGSTPMQTRTTPMQHKLIETDADFEALEPQWKRLLAASSNDLLPLTHFWTRIWWKNFGADARRQVHCFYRDQRLVAVAPTMLRTAPYRGMALRQRASMANGHSPHSGLLHERGLAAADIADIVRAIARADGAGLTSFLRVPETDELCMLMRNQQRFDGHPLGLRRGVVTPLIRMETDWETFFATRSQKFRKNMRNKANKFAKAPGCRIERRVVTSADEATLDELQEISHHSWKGKAGTDLASVPTGRTFLRDLMAALGPSDGVHIWMAWQGSTPIAYEFHARYGGVTYPLRADFDERHRELSPGSVVEYTALKESFEEGAMKLYDSCANDYWYLSNWTDELRVHYDIEIFGRGLKPRAAHAAEYFLVPLLRRWRARLRKQSQDDASRPAASH